MEIAATNAINTAVEGLKKAQGQIEQAAQNVAEGPVNPEDIVALSLAATSFKANAAVIRTESETLKTLLDVTV